MVVVGLLLGLAGIWSVRLALVTAGAGAAWLLADAFGAGVGTGLLIAAGGGVIALLTGVLASRVLFFAVGAVVGAVVGARLFAILDTGDASALLAVVFVPAVALVGGVVVEKWRERFIGWATAIGGAGLVLTGLGRLAPDTLGSLRDPQDTGGQLLAVLAWIALAVVGRVAQRRGLRSRRSAAGDGRVLRTGG
jgi:hypothetical protein